MIKLSYSLRMYFTFKFYYRDNDLIKMQVVWYLLQEVFKKNAIYYLIIFNC